LQADEKLFERRILAFDQIGERQGAGARNPLVMSGLVFAGANHSDTPERGILTADGIVGLDLRQLDLAVLSACETGLGEVAGGEGVYGLQRAFHVAGARQVVASLWHVDDAATAALMVLFYRKQWEDGLAPTDALRQAQLAIYFNPEAIPKWAKGERGPNLKTTVKATGQTTLAPPAGAQRTPARYWAAFVMSGISRPTQVADPGKK
jgi:CHAT domain-containing protein